MSGTRGMNFGRCLFAVLWFLLFATGANARYASETEALNRTVQTGMTGDYRVTLKALAENSTGPHPTIVENYLLPELKIGLFPTYKLSRQTGCLAIAIYYEARGEQVAGQVAVGQVILNRVISRKYPDNICDVVYQNAEKFNRCQFSFTCDGKMENPRNKQSWDQAMLLARILVGKDGLALYAKKLLLSSLLNQKLARSTHYHATYVRPGWSRRLERTGQIGQHIFYISARVWS